MTQIPNQALLFTPNQSTDHNGFISYTVKDGSGYIGTIKWHVNWKIYVFQPSLCNLYGSATLYQIRNFIIDLMDFREKYSIPQEDYAHVRDKEEVRKSEDTE